MQGASDAACGRSDRALLQGYGGLHGPGSTAISAGVASHCADQSALGDLYMLCGINKSDQDYYALSRY